MVKYQNQSEEQSNYVSQQGSQKYQSDSQYQSQSSHLQHHIKHQSSQGSFEGQNQQQDDTNQIQIQINNLQQEEQKIKQQLKHLPYGLILKQKINLEDKKNDILNKRRMLARKKYIQKQQKQTEKTEKHGPKEMPIHRRPPKKNITIFESTKQKSIDPRFQDFAGHYNQDLAMKSLQFIPKIQQQQIAVLKKTLQQSKKAGNSRNRKKLSQSDRKKLVQQYNKLTNQKRQLQLVSIEQEVKRNIRQKEEYKKSNRYNSNGLNSSYNYSGNNSYGASSYGSRTNDHNSHNNGGRSNINNKASSYSNNERESYGGKTFIDKRQFKEEFEKVKQSRMTDEDRKEYLKNKQKKLFRNQQVDRNNLMYETNNSFKRNNRT